MAAALGDPALIEDDDLVGVDHGRQAVGDDDAGAARRDVVQRLLDRRLGAAVEGAGRLVEDQDRRGLEQGAGDGDALLLAARQLETALADLRLVAVGQAGGAIVDRRAPRRRLDLRLAGAVPAIADVVADAVVEQNAVLRDDADRGAQARLGDAAY